VSNHLSKISTRELALDDPQAAAALNRILGGTSSDSAGVIADRLAEFHADSRRRQLRVDLLFATYEGNRLAGACLGLVSPGRAALMLVPPPAPGVLSRTAVGHSLTVARKASASRGLVLLQILQTPEDTELTGCLQQAGFANITTLLYMQRNLLPNIPARGDECSLRYVAFNCERVPAFCKTLARTYEGSLDCPELSGLRRPEDILASHRSAGEFDPNLWWLALRQDEPVGVLLLAPLRGGEIMEIVYLGVAQGARGTGVGDCLLNHAVAEGKRRCAQTMALAVDKRNAPALRLYARWGFSAIGERAAWIASNSLSEAYGPTRW
jgi:ribosomal protein S18 acetylase RimI-like enzyme